MSSYRIGQPIRNSVADIIRERQALLRSRKTGAVNEFYADVATSFYNEKTPWVRLSSAVDLYDLAKAEYFDVGLGDELARKNVLQGTSEFDQGYLDYYREGDRLQGTLDRQQLGLKPKPGIVGVSTTSHGMFGALRTTEITIQCWTPFDLDIIDTLYMRPGYSLLLEMGHTHYFTEDLRVQNDIVPVDFFQYGKADGQKLLDDLNTKKEVYRGSYESFYGVVKNFSWSLRPDGGYECKVKLVSKGEVLESLITTSIMEKVDVKVKGTSTLFGDTLDVIERIADEKRDSKNSQWLEIPESTYNSLVDIRTSPYRELKGIYSYRVLFDTTKKSSFETHITLGLFNEIVNNLILRENDNSSLYTKIHSSLDSNQFKTVSQHYSINPRICLLPKSGVSIGSADFKLEKNPNTPSEVNYNNGINSILISLNLIRSAIKASLEEDNTVNILSVYKVIFNSIQNATGNINNFNLHLDENTNTWHIVDRLFIDTQDTPVEVSLLGLDSFAKGVMLQSMLSPKISSMLAIGAQASQNPNSVLDSTAFSVLNSGLEDRVTPDREQPLKQNPKEVVAAITKLSESQEYLKDYITSIYFNNGGRKYSIADNVEKVAPIYRDALNRNIQATPSNGLSFAIPFELTLTLDGLGGLMIGESFTVSSELLPLSYKRIIESNGTSKVDLSNSQIGFLITGLNQQVNETNWHTIVRCQMYVLNGETVPQSTIFETIVEATGISPEVLEETSDTNYNPVLSRVSTNTTQQELASKINSAIPNEPEAIRAGVLFLARQEQNLKGFNYNYYGVMADIGRWTGGDTYFNGSFSSTEGAAGQGIRTSNTRYFASFGSDEDGIKFIANTLRRKRWQSVTDQNIASTYYRTWLGPADPDALIAKDNGRKGRLWKEVLTSIRTA